MKNGDRVTGKIVKKDGKNLVIATEQFGTVTTAWDQVSSIKADTPLTVALDGGKSMQGMLTMTDGKAQVGDQSANAADVVAVRNAAEQKAYERLLKPGWDQLWAGTATVGFAGSAGNAKTLTFTTGVTANRTTRNDKTSVYFNTIDASALVNGQSAQTAEAVRGGIGYDHNLNPRLFVNTFNDWEFDKFQNLDLRFVAGGGLGFHARKTAKTALDVVAGGDFNRSKFSTPLTTSSGEAYWGDTYSWKPSANTSLRQAFRMFNNLSQSGAYRMNFDVGTSTKIARWLTWNVSISDRYVSNPAPGRKTNDLLYTTGLGITFAR